VEVKLPEMVEEIPLALRRNMRFQHDGAAGHFAGQVRKHLTATYGDHWIGRGWPVACPPRSPDLTPMDFYLCGHIKTLIFMSPVDSKDDLIARIVKAAATTRAATWQSLSAHVILCCIIVGCVQRSVAIHSNICSKLVQYEIQLFFRILQRFR